MDRVACQSLRALRPARTGLIFVSMPSSLRMRRRLIAAKFCKERGDRARREPRRHGVRAARRNDRNSGAEHDAGGAREKGKRLGEHIAGLEIRRGGQAYPCWLARTAGDFHRVRKSHRLARETFALKCDILV